MRILLVAILTYKEVTMLEKRETTTAFHRKAKESHPRSYTPTLGQEDSGSLTADANTQCSAWTRLLLASVTNFPVTQRECMSYDRTPHGDTVPG